MITRTIHHARLIVSEQHAEQIGKAKGQPFTVFSYTHPKAKITCFGIEIKATGETIVTA